MKKNPQALTPECRIVYPDLLVPTSFKDSEQQYRATFLIGKHADISELTEAIQNAAELKFPGKPTGFYATLRTPIRNGDEKAEDENGTLDKGSFFYNNLFISTKSKYQPGLIDVYGDPITDPAQIYGGCLVRASLRFYAYEYLGNRGVGVVLLAVIKIADGEPIGGGRVDPKVAFADIIQQRRTVFEKDEIPY